MTSLISPKLDISVEDVQNASLFAIASWALFSRVYHNFTNSAAPFEALRPIVGVHAVLDLFVNKSRDVKLHHMCILGIFVYNNYYSVLPEHQFPFLYHFLNTEISSIFYVLKCWLPPNTVVYNLNNAAFYVSFAKFRIFDLYRDVIHNHSPFELTFQEYSHSNPYLSSILLISCYGLYILNLYWFLILNKILYKMAAKLVKNLDTDIVCHFLCSGLYCINIPLALCIYSRNPNEKFVFDVIGIIALSQSSFAYHIDVFKRLHTRQINECSIPNKLNVPLFFADFMSIHERSFLVVVTNYYNNVYLWPALLASGCIHAGSIGYCMAMIPSGDGDEDSSDEDSSVHSKVTTQSFMKTFNIVTSVPIACDILLVFANSPKHISIPFLTVNIIIGLLFVVEPFYKLTHVAFHVCLIAQTYYICLSSAAEFSQK